MPASRSWSAIDELANATEIPVVRYLVLGVVTCAPPSESRLRCSPFAPQHLPGWPLPVLDPAGRNHLMKYDSQLPVPAQSARGPGFQDRTFELAALRKKQPFGDHQRLADYRFDQGAFFVLAEFSGVTSRACTTLPAGGGAPMADRVSGRNGSVPNSRGCRRSALKLAPASIYCGW